MPLIQNDQTNPSGINSLLSSPSLQSDFIQNAVSEAVKSNLDWYNLDFEPSSGIQNLATQFGAFLTNFANAMHAQGKILSVDIAAWDDGAFWNYSIEGKSSVDPVLSMVTYDSNFARFENGVKAMLANVPLNKIAIGLITVSDDSTLAERFQLIKASNIECVMIWPSYPGFLTQIY
jgi:spore germination protein YaaH